MTKQNLAWKPRWQVVSRETVYASQWLSLHRDRIKMPDGSFIEAYHVVDFPRPAVAIIPVNAQGQIMLIEHERFINNVCSWEIPAGGIDDGEGWEASARRELEEECGCTGGTMTYLGKYHPSIGTSNQLFILYVALGVEQTGPIQDMNEVISARWFSVPEVRAMIDLDEIVDGFSRTGLLTCFFKGLLP